MTDNLARKPRLGLVKGAAPLLPPFLPSRATIVPEPRDTPRSDEQSRWLPVNQFLNPLFTQFLNQLTTQLLNQLTTQDRARWLSSLFIVLTVYAAPLAWWLLPERTSGSNTLPPVAMVIELAPVPVAPESQPQHDRPLGPEQAEATPPPEPEPIPEPEQEAPPAPPATTPDAAIKPESEPQPEEKTQPEEPPPPLEDPEDTPPKEEPASAASAPPDVPREGLEAAAPDRGVSVPAINANAIPTWQNSLMLKLNEAKRYPTRARRYRQEGVAYLRFTMDRDGNVLTKSIEHSAGHPLLDEEALALIDRAQPLPEPPAAMQGEQLEFVIPVEFFLNR